ncbi:hypothetical protein [Ornithinimicrobium sp. LYQ103]|uniref:hypothetical protein n=1 Tax=Ornithinimicrobium sp. LYQ103 TaxID=3378796 RepID=UPI003853A65C
MDQPTACCRGGQDAARDLSYCDNCDLLVGLDGYHVLDVARGQGGLVVRDGVVAGAGRVPDCGVRAASLGRREHPLVGISAFGTPVRLAWVKRTWALPGGGVAALVHRDDEDL